MIGSTLLGLSMIDIYAFDFINWLKDTNIYRWYSELFNKPIVETKTDIKEPSSIMRSIDKNTTRNEERDETDYEILQRLQQLIHKDKDPVINQADEIEEDGPFYSKYKYFAIGAVIGVTCLVSWYYYGDNITSVGQSGIEKIKTGYGAIIDYLSSFRSTPPDDPGGSNTSGSAISDKSNIRAKLDKYFKTLDSKIIDTASSEIELLDNSQPIASTSKLDKGKGILTSPSLEDLNNQASESWAEGSSSPKSESSSSTITPSKFAESSSINAVALEHLSKNWNLIFSSDVRGKIKIINNALEGSVPLDDSRINFMAKILGELMAEYDVQTIVFNKNINLFTEDDIIKSRQAFYHFREWIETKSTIVLGEQHRAIDIGNINDNPKMIYSV